jgi:hypothetical protein
MRGTTLWSTSQKAHLHSAIIRAVAYADIFDYPLHLDELQRYLEGVVASPLAVRLALQESQSSPCDLVLRDGFLTLPGRESIIEARRRRSTVAAGMWRQAVDYGRIIASLPFVRMIAVTGALAVDNVEPGADIDYLIVTEPGRLWLCRAMIIAIVKVAARQSVLVCPNYFLSERALVLSERNLFIAHELVQMVPLAGHITYWRMRRLNAWTRDYLPNADGPPRSISDSRARGRHVTTLAEVALRTPVMSGIERWEMSRKVRKFQQQAACGAEAAFSPDWCKGHVNGHGERILSAFEERLAMLGLVESPVLGATGSGG